MTYSLFIVSGILGLWVIFHKSKYVGTTLHKLTLLALLFQVVSRYISSYNTEFALFALAKDAFILGSLSFILLLLKKNIFAQLGAFSGIMYLLFQWTMPNLDIAKVHVDPDWEILVDLKDGRIDRKLDDLIEYYGLSVERPFEPEALHVTELDDYLSLGIPKENENKKQIILDQLDDLRSVDWVELNEKVYRTEPIPGKLIQGKALNAVNDPMTKYQWSMQALKMEEYFNYIRSNNVSPAKKAKLYILDTGVQSDHEDIKGVFAGTDKRSGIDKRGHGTHVAGIAAGLTNNNKGIASLSPSQKWVELHSIKVISDLGFATQKAIISGIIRAVDEGADVINMSLGGRAYQDKERAYKQAIDYAKSKNVIIVVAAGNSNDSAKNFVPANLNDVITVSAVDSTLSRAHFSNFVNEVSNGIAAPGTEIISTFNDGKYKSFNGTSMASPHVAGLIAVMKGIKPIMNTEEAYQILEQTGIRTADTEKTGKMIYPGAAVRELFNRTN